MSEEWGLLFSVVRGKLVISLTIHIPLSPAHCPCRTTAEAGTQPGFRSLFQQRISWFFFFFFCLCHLPAHLVHSHDRLSRFLTSFQLSLITLQICKSCQACADREGDWSSALLSSGLLGIPTASIPKVDAEGKGMLSHVVTQALHVYA